MSEIYQPAEDSYLLSKSLRNFLLKNKINSFLEIGIGSGIHLKTAEKFKIKKIKGVDINKKAVSHCKKLGFDCLHSDLFSNVKGKFDLIIFNPPYLSEDKYDKEPDTTGGKKGSEVINIFLKQSKKHLTKKGKILLLTSSLTKGIIWKGFNKKKTASKKLFFEELYVWQLSLPN